MRYLSLVCVFTIYCSLCRMGPIANSLSLRNHSGDESVASRYLYDWKSPNKYRSFHQGNDPTCLLACGASIEGIAMKKFITEFENSHGPITNRGKNVDVFKKYMEDKGYSSITGPRIGRTSLVDIGKNLKKGYHTIAIYPESSGHHAVLVKRIRVKKNMDVKMTFINSQFGRSQTQTFPITKLKLIQLWKE